MRIELLSSLVMTVNVLQCLCQGVQAHVSNIHGNEVVTELSRDFCQ